MPQTRIIFISHSDLLQIKQKNISKCQNIPSRTNTGYKKRKTKKSQLQKAATNIQNIYQQTVLKLLDLDKTQMISNV